MSVKKFPKLTDRWVWEVVYNKANVPQAAITKSRIFLECERLRDAAERKAAAAAKD
jgi:hypothetical protein